ncbi:MAG: CRTAC1 family protein [Rhizobacter sp.]|nr:CRTAC1 family protein [Bacteriovorax sp.]
MKLQINYKSSLYSLIVILLGSASVFYLFKYNPPKDRPGNVYEDQHFNHSKFTNLHFQESSSVLGIDYRNIDFVLKNVDPKKYITSEFVSPSVSVVDVNNDGFMDIYITTSDNKPNLLYINQGGKYFVEKAAAYNLANLNQKSYPSYALWADFNQDGRIDLLLARFGCHGLYLQSRDGKFIDSSDKLNGYCSRPDGVNVGDFYQTGRLDLVFANFSAGPDELTESNVLWMNNTQYDNKTGGKNKLLRNTGKEFVVEEKADFITRSYTHNAGIADVNLDGLPDIFFANDYAHDELFLNKGQGVFQDVTEEYLPKIFHGLSGMNSEFFDYNRDGLLDLYVTNIYKPPFYRKFNLLWKKKADGRFENVSTDTGSARCGFSWGAKFADIDHDGQDDLLIANGRTRSPEIKNINQGKSMWYERIEVSQIPRFLRKYYHPKTEITGRYISAFEHNCFFAQKNGKFFDISKMSGFDDTEENKTLALIDYDNDGKMDVITAGGLAKLKIYHNTSEIKPFNHWIGFSLIDKNGNTIPHGARVKFKLSNGETVLREIYPANGYRGFSDARVNVGLGKSTIVGDVEVYWPISRSIKKIRNFKIDQYNSIRELQ